MRCLTLLLGLLLLPSAACLPLPYISPPVYAEVAGGWALGQPPEPPTPEPAPTPQADTGRGLVTVRAGVAPLQLWQRLFTRHIDLRFGYLFQALPRADRDPLELHGASMTVGFRPWLKALPRGGQMVLELATHGELLANGQGSSLQLGGGAGFGISYELVSFITRAPFSTLPAPSTAETAPRSDSLEVIGVAHGEAGVGFFIDASYQTWTGRHYALIQGGLRLRLPASVGVLLVWLTGLHEK